MRARAQRFLLLAILSAGAVVWVGSGAGTALVSQRDLPDPDAILMLASHEWERLPVTADLAQRHPDSVVLLSQPVRPTPENCHLCGERPGWLAALGVERSRIDVMPRRVVNTYDEALAAREYMAARHLRSLLVVTSPYHTRRALATFLTVFGGGGTAIGIRPASETSPARPDRWWAAPYDRAYVRYEWAAIVWYALRHHVSLSVPR
jgi:uncharacterized SAM-binding protein YcdF (DUF218 family)